MDSSTRGSLFSPQQVQMVRHTPTEQVYKKTVTSNKKKKERSSWFLSCLGVALLLLALFVILVNPIDRAITMAKKFGPGSFMLEQWMRPPTKVSLMFYVFNYTNPEAFLSGEENLRIEELGPYTYEEIVEIRNLTFNSNGTVSYVPTYAAKDDPGMTVGNPLEDIVTVPNFAFLGLASYLAESSFFTNMAFNVFTSMVKSQPFLTMTVDEYLRGYDEPLLKYANKIVPGMVSFDKMGYLDRVINEGENVVTITTNDVTTVTSDDRVVEPFTVDQYNGSPGMAHWGYEDDDNSTHMPCNTLQGLATEGVLIPRKINKDTTLELYRKAFCRKLPILFDRVGVTSKGVPAYWVKVKEDAMHNSNPENSCFCDEEEEPCLADGLSDIGPCVFGMPLAMSFPHFLHGDPSLVEAWEGLNPDTEKHGSRGLIDNNYGVVIHANIRIQLNLIMKKTKYNALVKPFNGMVLPAIWLDYNFNELPDFYHNVLYIGVVILPIVHYALFALLAALGVALLLRVLLCLPNTKTMYRRLSLHRSSARSYAGGNGIKA